MKIYEFKCPSCGADLETDGSQRIVQCKYCRKALYIDYKTDPITVSIPDARQAGREFELGRMDARRDASSENAQIVGKIIENTPVLMELEDKKKHFEENIERIQSRIGEMSKPDAVIMPVLTVLLVIAAMSVVYSEPAMLLMGVPAAAILYVLVLKQRNDNLRKLRKRLKKSEKSLEIVNLKIDAVHKDCRFDLVPEKYRSPERLEFLRNILESFRASTIPEAINIYESEQKYNELADQNKKLLEIQQLQTQEILSLKSKLV